MTDLRFNADLFRIAYTCVSTEETRYYLGGVFMTPAKNGGALMVSTDGHRMAVIHDEDAIAPEGGVIVKAYKPALTLMKRGKRMIKRLVSAGGDKIATATDGMVWQASLTDITDGDPVESFAGAAMLMPIDGSFPDWRRVVPRIDGEAKSIPTFNAGLVGGFVDMANDLAKLRQQRTAPISIKAADASSPALVGLGDPRAFGVLMPLRPERGEEPALPSWL